MPDRLSTFDACRKIAVGIWGAYSGFANSEAGQLASEVIRSLIGKVLFITAVGAAIWYVDAW